MILVVLFELLGSDDEAGARQNTGIGIPARPKDYCAKQTEADRLVN